MSKTFWTSDLHLDHGGADGLGGILEYTQRSEHMSMGGGMADIESHNRWIIKTINDQVGERDRLYFLGDMTIGGNRWMAGYWISQINCIHKELIAGNHDDSLFEFYRDSGLFETTERHRKEIKLNGKRIVMDHHPSVEWNNGHHQSWHLHGHSHGNFDYKAANLHDKRILDVGWDNSVKVLGHYGVFSFDDVEKYMEGRVSINHHGKAD
jgi:calcineurin-like phosphoesterase family protein